MIEPMAAADHSTVATHHMIHTQQKGITNTSSSSSSCKQQVLDELDDPNELWRRPHSVWVALCIYSHSYYQNNNVCYC